MAFNAERYKKLHPNLIKGRSRENLEMVIHMLQTKEMNIVMGYFQDTENVIEDDCKTSGCVLGYAVSLLSERDLRLLKKKHYDHPEDIYFVLCREYFGITAFSTDFDTLFGKDRPPDKESRIKDIRAYITRRFPKRFPRRKMIP